MSSPLEVAVLVSGQGSNLRALLEAVDRGQCSAHIACVVSDRASAPALQLASTRGIPTAVVSPKEFADRATWDATLAACVAGFKPELVVLAGFMRLIGAEMLARFEGRIINVHPALLPAFPGIDAPAQAVKAKVALSGCTVHVVDAGVDTGPILAQAAVPVLPDDDAPALHARIQRAEHALLPQVVEAIAKGQYALGPAPHFLPRRDPESTPWLVWPKLSE